MYKLRYFTSRTNGPKSFYSLIRTRRRPKVSEPDDRVRKTVTKVLLGYNDF